MTSRFLADRRRGLDRRVMPRRQLVAGLAPERRRLVDRRHGAERRSTLERRGRANRYAAMEAPSEHVRNALQVLADLSVAQELSADQQAGLRAAEERLHRALAVLEHR